MSTNETQINYGEPILEDYLVWEDGTFYLDLSDLPAPMVEGISYEQGDKIRWKWDGVKYFGTLQLVGSTPGLFRLLVV